jgi:hypothetical protein
MEGEGCQETLLQSLEKEQVLHHVKTLTTDDDSSVKKLLAEDSWLAHVKV